MDNFDRRFGEHMASDEKLFTKISTDIERIKDNHLAHIQEAMTIIQVDIATIKTDKAWLKWIAVTALGALITSFISLMYSH